MTSSPHHLLGRVLDRLGRPEEAREMYLRSRELAGA
jgi:Flp pilus assembly protein TadD